jgi:hypothetical protein
MIDPSGWLALKTPQTSNLPAGGYGEFYFKKQNPSHGHGRVAAILSTEALPYRLCVFVDRLIGKTDEDRNGDYQ